MNRHIIFAAVLVTLALSTVVHGETKKQKEEREASKQVPRISAKLAHEKFERGAIIADTMNPTTFSKYHVLGAVNLPTDNQENRKRWSSRVRFPKDQEIVLYCD